MAIAVVGDVHGNSKGLRAVLARVTAKLGEDDPVVFLGDYIDGGPAVKEAVQSLLDFRDSRRGPSVFLQGNHEQWFLRSIEDPTKHSWILSMRGLSTIGSYAPRLEEHFRSLMQRTGPALISDNLELPYEQVLAAMPESHVKFFRELRTAYEDEHCICTHAGLSCDFQGLSHETDRDLVWGSESFPDCYAGSKTVVYGHFSKRARLVDGVAIPLQRNNTICLDTSKHGAVSALILPQRLLVQSKGGST